MTVTDTASLTVPPPKVALMVDAPAVAPVTVMDTRPDAFEVVDFVLLVMLLLCARVTAP